MEVFLGACKGMRAADFVICGLLSFKEING